VCCVLCVVCCVLCVVKFVLYCVLCIVCCVLCDDIRWYKNVITFYSPVANRVSLFAHRSKIGFHFQNRLSLFTRQSRTGYHLLLAGPERGYHFFPIQNR